MSNEPVDLNSLSEVDIAAARAIESVRRCEGRGIADEDGFAAAFNAGDSVLRFTFDSVLGRCAARPQLQLLRAVPTGQIPFIRNYRKPN